MAIHIKQPTRIKSAGNKVKIIDEFIGQVNSRNSDVSVAKMQQDIAVIKTQLNAMDDKMSWMEEFLIKNYKEY